MDQLVNPFPGLPLYGVLGRHPVDAVLFGEHSNLCAGSKSGSHLANNVLGEFCAPIAFPVCMPKVCDGMRRVFSDSHNPKIPGSVVAAVKVDVVDVPRRFKEGLGDNSVDPLARPFTSKVKNDFVVTVFLDGRAKDGSGKRSVDPVTSQDNPIDRPNPTKGRRLVCSARRRDSSPLFCHSHPPVDYSGKEERWER